MNWQPRTETTKSYCQCREICFEFCASTKLAAQGSSHGYGGKHKVSRYIVEALALDLGGAPNDGQGIGSDPRFNTRGTAGIGGPVDVEALCDQLDQRRADLR